MIIKGHVLDSIVVYIACVILLGLVGWSIMWQVRYSRALSRDFKARQDALVEEFKQRQTQRLAYLNVLRDIVGLPPITDAEQLDNLELMRKDWKDRLEYLRTTKDGQTENTEDQEAEEDQEGGDDHAGSHPGT